MAEVVEWHRTWATPSLIISSSFATQLSSFLVNLQGLSLLSCAACPLHIFRRLETCYLCTACVHAHACTHTHAEWLRPLEICCPRPVVLSNENGLNLPVFRAGFLTLYTKPTHPLRSCKHCWPYKEGRGGRSMNHVYKTNESRGHGVLAGSYSGSD